MKLHHCLTLILATASLALLAAGPARALPTLQIYIEDSVYDTGSQTWLSDSGNFRLWVVGAFEAGESILDVRLSAAFSADETGSLSFTPVTTSYGGVTDTYLPPQAPILQYSAVGATPVDLDGDGDLDPTPIMADGTNISHHGIFGQDTNWYQYQLGDMVNDDETLIGDFQNAFPALGPHSGEIFAYDVTVTGFESGVHLDAFNHVAPTQGHGGSVFAPYSHDSEYITPMPEPGVLVLLGTGFATLAGFHMRRRRQ